MYQVLIADDEQPALKRLTSMLERIQDFKIVAVANNGDEALQAIITQKIDVAFLDINMPGMNVFQTLNNVKNIPLTVFQTAFSQYAVDAFEINAVDYLLKPYSEERFNKTIEKLRTLLSESDNKSKFTPETSKELTSLSVKYNGRIIVLPISEILRISFEEGFSCLFTSNNKYYSDKYLNYYEEKLQNHNFIRVNRNDIVRITEIKAIHPVFQGGYVIEMSNGMQVKVSRRRIKDLKDAVDI